MTSTETIALAGDGRPETNPYRIAVKLALHRLKWDLSPQSWASRARLRAWKDRYAGRKAVILGNGPSLLKTDFSLLEGVFTFGLNKINLLFEKSRFRPSCIVAVNGFVIEQNADFYNRTELPLFLDYRALGRVKPRDNVMFLHECGQRRFARDCSMSIYQGFTVTFVAMQLAYHMGFRDVAIIGCDHNFAVSGPANKTVVSDERDESHFDPNYFAGGVKWQLPDLYQSEISYTMAREAFAAGGGRIVNATEGGKLEVYPRMPLAAFVSGKEVSA